MAAVDSGTSAIPERLLEGTPAWERYYHEHIQRYEFATGYTAGRTVLDAACGVGYGSRFLAEHGARGVVGVDISAEAIREAERRYTHPSVHYQQGDVRCLDLADESVDTVVSFETIEHVPDPAAFVAEMARVLRPGGTFLCSTPNRRFHTQEENPYHLSAMDLDEFSGLLEPRFNILQRLHQSHSASYLRHLDTVRAIENVHRVVRLSRLLRMENRIRQMLGREPISLSPFPPNLERVVPGDYEIGPVDTSSDTHLTYLLVAEKRD